MTRRGRKPLGPQLVEHLPGSPQAKQRLQVMLETLARDRSVPEACAVLGIGESLFHRERNEALQAALGCLEPRPLGRPANIESPEAVRVQELERENARLKAELEAARVRLELAQALPYVRQCSATELKKMIQRSSVSSPASTPTPAAPSAATENTSTDLNTVGKPR